MWQRRIGFWLADLGNWIAGWPWGTDHYGRGVKDALTSDEHYTVTVKFKGDSHE